MKPTLRLLLFLALGLLCGMAQAAGQVLFVKGSAQLERGGKIIKLVKGTRVQAGDLLVTGADGRVQLAMDDDDRMALHPGTRLRIDAFKRPVTAQKPESGQAFYSLLRGGFRALTRSLGRRGEASYRVNTPVATLGIRGTSYNLQYCANDCSDPNGLYAGVDDGGVWIKNDAGMIELQKNQYGYVADQNSGPKQLAGAPKALGGSGSSPKPNNGDKDLPVNDVLPPDQTIQGTDPFGNPVDLTPGVEPHRGPPNTDGGGPSIDGGLQ